MANPWLEKIGVPVPAFEDLAGRKRITLRDLMIASLLHAGRPLALPDLVARLDAAGVRARSGSLELSLPRAWRGQAPVWRDSEGRFGLDLNCTEMDRFLLRIGVRRRPGIPLPPPPPVPEMPPDEVPLTVEEVALAFQDRHLYAVPVYRQAGAVLESERRSMPLDDVEDILRELSRYRSRLRPQTFCRRPPGPVTLDDEGVLRLDAGHTGMPGLRRQVRKLAWSALRERLQEEHIRKVRSIVDSAITIRRRGEAAEAMTARRGIVRALPVREPALFGRLDVATREIHTWPAAASDEVARDLAGYDVIAGLKPREVLAGLDVDPDAFVLRDLSPPQKTRRLNRRGRVLKLSPELLITSSVRISRPLADPKKVAQYVVDAHEGRLRRRLESDLKTLFAFYRYGALHRSVRLRWGFLDEDLRVDWAEKGDLWLYDLLKSATEGDRTLEVVTGHAPSFTNPWSRARRVKVTRGRPFGYPTLIDAMTGEEIPLVEVQAARMV